MEIENEVTIATHNGSQVARASRFPPEQITDESV